MSFSGTGTFNINSAGQPVVAGTTITATAFNALTADLATGLSTCITKDGQQTVTANIPFANFRLTGVGAGTSGTDAATVAQVQGSASALVTVTGTDTLTGSMTPALTTYATGNQFAFVAANTNTTAVTLNIDGLGAKAITRDGSTALVAGDITSGKAQLVVYDGTRFQLLNSPSFTNLKATTLAVSGATTLSSNVTIATPASGVALTVTGQSGANIASFQATATSDAGIIFGITSSQQWNLRTTYSDGSFRLYDQTRVAYPLIVSTAGNVTIAAPASNVALTVTGVTANNVANFLGAASNSIVSIQSTAAASVGVGVEAKNSVQTWQFGLGVGIGDSSWYLHDATRIAQPLRVTTSGNVTIAAPSSGRTLTATGTAAGTAALRLDTTATNAGTQTATWTAPTNKPGAAAGVVSQWIPIDLDGTTYYIPAWT